MFIDREAELAFFNHIDSDTWQVTYIFFARSGYTQAAREYARQQGVQLVNLSQMMSVLDTA